MRCETLAHVPLTQCFFDTSFFSQTIYCFFFAEKIRSSDARNQEMTNEIFKNWKLDQRFSLSEVNFKTESLKGVLDPFTHNGNLGMLKRAGFDEINVISKYLNFEILLAIK